MNGKRRVPEAPQSPGPRRALLVLLLVGLVAAPVLWSGSYTERTVWQCTACSAGRTDERGVLLGMTIWRDRHVESTRLADLRERVLGGCSHRWAFRFAYRPAGEERGYPEDQYPLCDVQRDRLLAGLVALPRDLQRKAFDCMADRANRLAWLTHGVVTALADMPADARQQIDWPSWRETYGPAFVPAHDAAEATSVAAPFRKSDLPTVRRAAAQCYHEAGQEGRRAKGERR